MATFSFSKILKNSHVPPPPPPPISSPTYRELIIGILDNVVVSAAKLVADEILIVTDFYNALSIKNFYSCDTKYQVMFAIDDQLPDDLRKTRKFQENKQKLFHTVTQKIYQMI